MKTVFEKIYVVHYLDQQDRYTSMINKFKYLGLKFEFVYSLPVSNIFKNTNNKLTIECTNPDGYHYIDGRMIENFSTAFGHYMAVYQAYKLGYNNVLIFENDVIINTDKDLIFRYLYDVPKDADIIRYGYMSNEESLKQRFDNTNDLFYKDNTNDYYTYFGNQCYGLMNRKTMKIYLDSSNNLFKGNEDVINIHRGNEYNLNIYFATNPLFIDPNVFNIWTSDIYKIPYSDKLINSYKYMK